MKRFALCLCLICLVLCSCHGRVEHALFELPDDFDEGKQYEITFWAKNENNENQRAIYADAVAGFEKLYPNIKVTLSSYTDYGTIRNDVLTNLATSTTPNVCITYPDHVAEYMQGENVIVPLDELMVDPRYGLSGSEVKFDSPAKDEIIPSFLDECIIDGHYYAMPYMRSTEACYVNKTYVEALGYTLPDVLTWDFVFEVSNAALAKNDDGKYKVNGKEVMIPFVYKSTDNMMIQMIRQKGGEYSTDKGEVLIFNDTTKELLTTIHANAKTGAFSTFERSGYPANLLNAGECIFAVDSTAGATWMGAHAPLIDISADKLVEFETAVMAVPQFDTDNVQMISQGPSVCIFNKDDAGEVLASWLFVQYLLTNEVQIAYSSTEGYLPVTSKAHESEEYKDYLSRIGEDNSTYYDVKINAAKLLLANTKNTFVTPVFNGSASLRDAAGEMINDVTKAAYRKKNVDSAYVDKLYGNVSSLYRLDQIQNVNTSEDGTRVKAGFGELPTASVMLIAALSASWAFIGLYFVTDVLKNRKK